jgi:O-antigen ligase
MSVQAIGSQHTGDNYLHGNELLLTLLGVCLILTAVLLSQLASPGVVFGVTGLIIACVVVPTRWPYGALLILSIASVMPCVKVDIGGWNARPEHCAALLVLGVFLFRSLFRSLFRAVPKISLTAPDYWVAAYVLWNYVSSAIMSPDPRMTLRWALLTNFVVLPYFLIHIFIVDRRTLDWAFKAFLGIGIAECTYALICYICRQLAGTSFGVEVGQYGAGLEGVYGTQYEPNILGSYSACLAVMLLVLFFLKPRRGTNWLAGGIIIVLASLLVSLSRAAFLSFALTTLILLLFGIRSGRVRARKLLPITLGIAVFIAPVALTTGKHLVARFANLSGDEVQNDSETMERLISWTVALQDIWQHPIVGNGTASFQLLTDAKKVPMLGDRPWVANSVIRIVHDTGIIGLLLFFGMIFSLGRRTKTVIAGSAPERAMVIALLGGCLVYAIAFMAAEGTMLSFFWVHMGLLSSACSFATKHVLQVG